MKESQVNWSSGIGVFLQRMIFFFQFVYNFDYFVMFSYVKENNTFYK